MAYDEKTNYLYVAGGEGELAVLDGDTGALIKTLKIPAGVDQIALDVCADRLYCPSHDGTITVIQTGNKPGVLGSVMTHLGVHTIAIDAASRIIWVAYGDSKSSHIVKLTPTTPTPAFNTPRFCSRRC